MGKKLYVGNLTYGVSDSILEQLFSQFGTVQSAQVIQDRATGRSKGFGFVEMDTEAQAQAAIEGLHDQEHDGRRLTVNEAKPREDRGGGGGYGGWRRRSVAAVAAGVAAAAATVAAAAAVTVAAAAAAVLIVRWLRSVDLIFGKPFAKSPRPARARRGFTAGAAVVSSQDDRVDAPLHSLHRTISDEPQTLPYPGLHPPSLSGLPSTGLFTRRHSSAMCDAPIRTPHAQEQFTADR